MVFARATEMKNAKNEEENRFFMRSSKSDD